MAATVKPPVNEIGVQTQPVPQPARGAGGGVLTGWSSFIDEHEYVPELIWPASIPKYHQMRSDAQVDALHFGSTMPIREMRWSLDPNGCSAALTEQAAEDFGLPIRGHEDDNVPMASYRFNFDEFLADALLSLLYGHMYFEQVAYLDGDAVHVRKLAPRHPKTIGSFVLDPDGSGGLVGIRQNIARWQNIGTGQSILIVPPIIPIERLVAFVWRREAGSWIGRSMLRSIYREWMVKDRTIRIAAINLERAGGMPVVEGPQGASDKQISDLAQMARQFKVAEGGGGAIPFGSKLHLVGGNAPAATDLIRYCDEAMARVWALMLIQLGQTETGSRALGTTFDDVAAKAQRAIAGWVRRIFDEHVLKDYVEWNNPASRYAPRLHCEESQEGSLGVDQLVALITAKALTVDEELEAWLRGEHGLPDLGPGGRPSVVPPPAPPQIPPPAPGPGAEPAPAGTAAALSHRPREVRAMTLPARKLRRQPYDVEVRAAVDFGALDAAFDSSAADAERLYREVVIPAQIDALEDQVRLTKSGTVRQRVTKAAMAALQAPGVGRDELASILLDAARTGASTALSEAQAQGVFLSPVEDAVLAQLVSDQADAMTRMGSDGLSLAAARKATALVGGGRTPDQLAAEMGQHLRGMKHQWSIDQLKGSIAQAQSAGRFEIMRQAEGEGVSFYISALLDVNCCAACIEDDGREFATIEAMRAVLPSGGNARCEGGPRCRCTGVMVRDEQSPLPSSNPVVPIPALA